MSVPPACSDQATSPEVWSPSAHTSRDALSGAGIVIPAGLRTIPLRRFDPANPRRACGPIGRIIRPCGFSLSAEQSGVARSGGRSGLVHALRTRRTVATRCGGSMSFSRSSRRSITRAGEVRGNRKSRSGGSDHSSASALIRLPSRVMHRRVPSARCSATRTAHLQSQALMPDRLIEPRSGPSRPGRTSGPSLVVRRRSWGSTLRSLDPASGGPASLPSRAHVPFAPLARPD